MHTLTCLEEGSMPIKSLGVPWLYCNKSAENPEQQTPRERGTLLCHLYRGKPLDRVHVWFWASLSRTGRSRYIILGKSALKRV